MPFLATSTIAMRCPNLPRLCRAEFDAAALDDAPFLRLAVARMARMGSLAAESVRARAHSGMRGG